MNRTTLLLITVAAFETQLFTQLPFLGVVPALSAIAFIFLYYRAPVSTLLANAAVVGFIYDLLRGGPQKLIYLAAFMAIAVTMLLERWLSSGFNSWQPLAKPARLATFTIFAVSLFAIVPLISVGTSAIEHSFIVLNVSLQIIVAIIFLLLNTIFMTKGAHGG